MSAEMDAVLPGIRVGTAHRGVVLRRVWAVVAATARLLPCGAESGERYAATGVLTRRAGARPFAPAGS
ncbi:hypothetical protein ABT273_21965, partial [Streptomyces humidus]|uniref:hypothetical protein n=1 Tax=Streptomyces humidus TaxID=52259 RepID=UPI00332C676B